MHENDTNYASVTGDQLTSSYIAEVDQFAKVTTLTEFKTILSYFSNYKKFLREKIRPRDPMPAIIDATNGNRILSVKDLNKTMRYKFYAAQVAACCVLFKGEQYVNDMLNSQNIHDSAMNYITSIKQSGSGKSKDIMQRINALDSVRMIHLLRILGLLQRPSSKMYQLGLGAAAGIKDIYYVHAMPKITREKRNGINTLKFNYSQQSAADVILFDFDPRFKSTYDQYSRDPGLSVSGYIGETMDLLKIIANKDIKKRNLITMLRVEPAMIPDSSEFLRHLHPVIDKSCDLVLSIGSGDTAEAYKNRIDLMESMFNDLNKAGLSPVLIKLHNGGTLMEQASSLQSGSPIASSYEIIYCSLDPVKLCKTFGDNNYKSS